VYKWSLSRIKSLCPTFNKLNIQLIQRNKNIIIMKIKEFSILLFVLLLGCKSEEIDFSKTATPRIMFMVDSLKVDLNSSTIPEIVSVVQAEAGLLSVTQHLIKSGDAESVYEDPITSFPNPNSYSISQLLPFTEDIVGFRVEVKDKGGRTQSVILPINVIPLRDAPKVIFTIDGKDTTLINYREGERMPVIKIKTSSQEKLLKFAVSKVINRVETSIPITGLDTVKFTNQETQYQIDLSVDSYQFVPNTTALKVYVSAGDTKKPKIKVGTLKVNFIEIPGPVVVFTDGTSKQVNEFSDLTISGSITAGSKIKHIKFIRKINTGNSALSEVSLSPSQSSYSFSIPLTRLTMNDSGLIVEATDDNNKTTSSTFGFIMNELAPAPVISIDQTTDAFNGVDAGQNLQLTGSITTNSTFQSVNFVSYNNAGDKISSTPVVFTGKKVTLDATNANYAATKATRRIGIEAIDVNGKTTNAYRDVHVGYYFAKVFMSLAGEDSKATSLTGPLPGPFFSAKYRRAVGYTEGKTIPMDCDIAFHAQATYGAIRCGNITYAKSSAKFTLHTMINAGLETWGASTNYNVNTASGISLSTFDATTIDDLSKQTNTGTAQSPVIANGVFPAAIPADIVVTYQAQIDGLPKTVILAYDSFGTVTADKSSSTFYIKVKIQK